MKIRYEKMTDPDWLRINKNIREGIEDLRIFKRIPIDWADLFKQAEIEPCKARLCFTRLGGWTLDVGDPALMLCVEPPEVEGSTKTIIRDGEWCFCS
jgi:hypothetical protein